MKSNKRLALVLLMVLVSGVILTQTSLGYFILTSPWWVFVVIIGIIMSGYLAIKYSLEEKRLEDEWIESEGNVYIRRMEEERERRNVKRS